MFQDRDKLYWSSCLDTNNLHLRMKASKEYLISEHYIGKTKQNIFNAPYNAKLIATIEGIKMLRRFYRVPSILKICFNGTIKTKYTILP